MAHGDRTEDAEDEQQAGQVEGAHQAGQLGQAADAVLADGVGHGAEGTDRGDLHDHADDAEEDVRQTLDEVEDRLAALAEGVQRVAEEHREEQHLQHVALGEGIDDAGRDDVHQELRRRLHLAGRRVLVDGRGVERGRIDVHAGAGRPDIDDDQADDEGDRADHLEIEHGQAAGLADLLHVFHAGDADDDGAEDDRRDDHLDQLDESVAQRLHRRAGFRIKMAEQDADRDGDQYLDVEALENLLHCFPLMF